MGEDSVHDVSSLAMALSAERVVERRGPQPTRKHAAVLPRPLELKVRPRGVTKARTECGPSRTLGVATDLPERRAVLARRHEPLRIARYLPE